MTGVRSIVGVGPLMLLVAPMLGAQGQPMAAPGAQPPSATAPATPTPSPSPAPLAPAPSQATTGHARPEERPSVSRAKRQQRGNTGSAGRSGGCGRRGRDTAGDRKRASNPHSGWRGNECPGRGRAGRRYSTPAGRHASVAAAARRRRMRRCLSDRARRSSNEGATGREQFENPADAVHPAAAVLVANLPVCAPCRSRRHSGGRWRSAGQRLLRWLGAGQRTLASAVRHIGRRGLIYPGCAMIAWRAERRRANRGQTGKTLVNVFTTPSLWKKLNPVQITANMYGRASLPELPIFAFSLIIIGLLLISGANGLLSGLSTDVLLLLGISGVGTAGARYTYWAKRRISLESWAWLVESNGCRTKKPRSARSLSVERQWRRAHSQGSTRNWRAFALARRAARKRGRRRLLRRRTSMPRRRRGPKTRRSPRSSSRRQTCSGRCTPMCSSRNRPRSRLLQTCSRDRRPPLCNR